MIDWTEVIIGICYIIITGVLVPLGVKWYKSKVSKEKQEEIEYWVTIAVRWAKQELWDHTNEEKKASAMEFLENKFEELGIKISLEDLSKIVEAIYGEIKDELAKPTVA